MSRCVICTITRRAAKMVCLDLDHPDIVDRAVLTAPMIDIGPGPFLHAVLSTSISLVTWFGGGRWYAPRQKGFDPQEMKFAGKGFLDTSRIASGPANIWADVLLTNTGNISKGIDKVIAELTKFKKAIKSENKREIERLLEKAKDKRTKLINYKIKNKEMIS